MAEAMKYEKYLKRIYFDPRHAGAFGGVDKLFRALEKRVNSYSEKRKFAIGF